MSEEKKLPGIDPVVAEFTFPDGTGINFDLTKITRKQFSSMQKGDLDDTDAVPVLAKVVGLPLKQFQKIADEIDFISWKKFLRAFYRAAYSPLGPEKN